MVIDGTGVERCWIALWLIAAPTKAEIRTTAQSF